MYVSIRTDKSADWHQTEPGKAKAAALLCWLGISSAGSRRQELKETGGPGRIPENSEVSLLVCKPGGDSP